MNNNSDISFRGDKDYLNLISTLKQKIRSTQTKAVLSVNNQLIELYWYIGKSILAEQNRSKWGHKIIDQLSLDLIKEFPDMKGFSVRNLKYMRKFAYIFTDFQFVQQVAAQLPWGHNLLLMDKTPKEIEYLWYAKKTIEFGWSRSVLMHQIELNLYKRQGGQSKLSNFKNTLPKPQSELAEQTLKDPYIFDVRRDMYYRILEPP